MARTKGMLNLSGNLEVNAGAPLDARSVVPTVADLTVAANFQYKYVGMTVVVQATGDMYILTANDVTVAANWKQVGSGGGGSSYTAGDGIVIDNDEISTDNMPAADMSEIVTPLPSVMSRLPILFDETGAEQVVGWYRYSNETKKPVYQKIINFGTLPNTNIKSVNHDINNIDKVIKIWATASDNSTYIGVPIPYTTTDHHLTGEGITLLTTSTQIQISTSVDRSAFSAYVTLQYTKTTDTPI